MKYYLPHVENITASNIGEDQDENGDTYVIHDVVLGYNTNTIVKFEKNIYQTFNTILPLAHYIWRDLVVDSEFTTKLHTQTDIYPIAGQILIEIVIDVTVVYVESNKTYYIAKTTGTVDFMAEDILSPVNFNVIPDPILYRHNYNYPDGFKNTIFWNYLTVSNKHRPFDKAVGSQAERVDEITYTFVQNSISAIIFLNVEASEVKITVTDILTNAVFPTQTKDMIDTSHLDSYEKVCTVPPVQSSTAFFVFASRFSMQIDAVIKNTGLKAKVGVIKFGLLEDIGITLDGVNVRNKSYNESGIRDNGEYVWNPTDKESNKVSLIDYNIIYPTSLFDSVDRKLKLITDKDVVILGDERDENAFQALQNYCVITSANATLTSNNDKSKGDISVETFV